MAPAGAAPMPLGVPGAQEMLLEGEMVSSAADFVTDGLYPLQIRKGDAFELDKIDGNGDVRIRVGDQVRWIFQAKWATLGAQKALARAAPEGAEHGPGPNGAARRSVNGASGPGRPPPPASKEGGSKAKPAEAGKREDAAAAAAGKSTPARPAARQHVNLVMASGHKDTFKVDLDDPKFVLKPHDKAEEENYKKIWAVPPEGNQEPLQRFVPAFAGLAEVALDAAPAAASSPRPGAPPPKGERFLKISNLLRGLRDPLIMDCKMGCRTYLEAEAANSKPRNDLFERLVKLAPQALSEEEVKQRAVTKYKWMATKDSLTTTTKLAFRIDGVRCNEHIRATPAELEAVVDRDGVLPLLLRVLPPWKADDDRQRRTRIALARQIVAQLELLHLALERSPFFMSHEVIGSSLLFITHNFGATVHLIDLAKTVRVPDGVRIDHRSPWEFGNHEDGYLSGLSALTECWVQVFRELEVLDGGVHCGAVRCAKYESELASLAELLRKHGVDTACWGTNGSSSLQELHYDVFREKSAKVETHSTGVCRVVELVRASVLAQAGGVKRVLMQLDQARGKATLLEKKIKVGAHWKEMLLATLARWLQLSEEVVERFFHVDANSHREAVEQGGPSSNDFPGLPSIFRVHSVEVRLPQSDAPELSCIGLPGGLSFVTIRHRGILGSVPVRWVWTPVAELQAG